VAQRAEGVRDAQSRVMAVEMHVASQRPQRHRPTILPYTRVQNVPCLNRLPFLYLRFPAAPEFRDSRNFISLL
jgi:hypothetical protein